MRKILASAAVLALVSGCADNGADADGDGKITNEEVAAEMNEVSLEAGEWENTVEIVDVEIEGMSDGMSAGMVERMKGQKTVSKSCITEEMAKDPGAEFFAAQKEVDCEVKKFTMSGGAIDSEMSCKNMNNGAGEMNMAMSGDYGSSSYDMVLKMDGDAGPMKMKISARNIGKRVGDCPAG
ncbi:MAG: DUF3617 domain-containing protein [Pseudomonadota bacterium]